MGLLFWPLSSRYIHSAKSYFTKFGNSLSSRNISRHHHLYDHASHQHFVRRAQLIEFLDEHTRYAAGWIKLLEGFAPEIPEHPHDPR